MAAAPRVDAGAAPPATTGKVDIAPHADGAPAAPEHGKKDH
jgi:hypothetical protein